MKLTAKPDKYYPGGRLLPVLCSCVLLLACSSTVPDDMPAIPEVSSIGFLPVISRQMEAARLAVQKHPMRAADNAHYAMVLHAYERFEPAAVLYQRALLLKPEQFEWLYLQAQVLAETGRRDEAITVLQAARSLRPGDPWAAIRQQMMVASGGYRYQVDAATELARLLPAHDNLPELHYALGRLYAMSGNLDQAIHHYQRALAVAGDFGAAHYGLSVVWQRAGDATKSAFHRSMSTQFEHVVATGSDPYLAKLQALDKSDIPLLKRAESLNKSGDKLAAIDLLKIALERNPDSVTAHISLLGLYGADGDFVKAEQHYEMARQLDSERAKLYYNLGLLRMMQQRYVEAEQAFRESLQRDRQSADTYIQLSLALNRQHRATEADATVRRALKFDPANRAARLLLAEQAYKDGRYQQVLEVLEGHYEPPDGGSAHLLLLMAKASNQLGDYQVASQAANRGIEIARLWNQKSLINQFKRQLQHSDQATANE